LKRGESINASLQHLVFFPNETEPRNPTVVALHGRGADAHDLVPLVDSLGFADMLVVAPRAPMLCNFGGGYAWYDLSDEGIPHQQSFNESLTLLRRFLVETEEGYPIDPTRLILLGFSQGTVMSYAAGLTEPSRIRAIVALSGYIPYKSGLSLQWDRMKEFRVFISHGEYDELIPVSLGRKSAEMLTQAGAKVTYHEYPMGHEITEETLRDLRVWMVDVLK